MKSRWGRLVEERGWDAEVAESCWIELAENYGAASRHYHNFRHIEDCLDQLTDFEPENIEAVELAIWFHDVIYDTGSRDNEAASGKFACQWLERLGEPPPRCAEVDRLINVTDHKIHPETDAERLLVDIDLSILGRDKADYDEYASKIRMEYSTVPDEAYRAGRSSVLRGFLERPSIYLTQLMHDRFEARAQANIDVELSFAP